MAFSLTPMNRRMKYLRKKFAAGSIRTAFFYQPPPPPLPETDRGIN